MLVLQHRGEFRMRRHRPCGPARDRRQLSHDAKLEKVKTVRGYRGRRDEARGGLSSVGEVLLESINRGGKERMPRREQLSVEMPILVQMLLQEGQFLVIRSWCSEALDGGQGRNPEA